MAAGSSEPPRPSVSTPRSLTTTAAPSRASSRAIPRPIPRPAPVTSATLPSSVPICPFPRLPSAVKGTPPILHALAAASGPHRSALDVGELLGHLAVPHPEDVRAPD